MRTCTNNRIVSLLLLTLVCFVLLLPRFTYAFFTDTEESEGQRFIGAELLFDNEFDNQELFVGPGLTLEHEFTLPVSFSSSSVTNLYDIRVASTTGNAEFCEALALETALAGNYTVGHLENFSSSAYDSPGEVTMTVVYDENERAIPHNATCVAEVVVEAWQDNMTKETAGYRDSKRFTISVTAHMVVLNEVLPRPNTTDTTVPNVEFIELYNNSDFPIDVLGFNITELTSGGLPTNHFVANIAAAPASAMVAYDGSLSTIVPAHGYLALKYRGSASYLNDTGDTITLIDTNTGAAIDSYHYTTTIVGKSDARIPDGVGAWIDPVPTPDSENIAEEPVLVVATTTATTSIFAELAVQEISTTTKVAATSTVASSTEEVMPTEEEIIVVEDVATTSEELVTEPTEPVVEENEVSEPEIVESIEEPQAEVEEPLTETLPLTEANTVPEEAILNPEPAVRAVEEEVEEPEEPEVTPVEI